VPWARVPLASPALASRLGAQRTVRSCHSRIHLAPWLLTLSLRECCLALGLCPTLSAQRQGEQSGLKMRRMKASPRRALMG